MLAWSDPRSVELDDIIATVAVYYLTGCFQTSVMIYKQSKPRRAELASEDIWGKIKVKMAYSLFVSPFPCARSLGLLIGET